MLKIREDVGYGMQTPTYASFNLFYFSNVYYFPVFTFVILLNLLNAEIKRILSDGFNTAAIGNSLKKSHKFLRLCHANKDRNLT